MKPKNLKIYLKLTSLLNGKNLCELPPVEVEIVTLLKNLGFIYEDDIGITRRYNSGHYDDNGNFIENGKK